LFHRTKRHFETSQLQKLSFVLREVINSNCETYLNYSPLPSPLHLHILLIAFASSISLTTSNIVHNLHLKSWQQHGHLHPCGKVKHPADTYAQVTSITPRGKFGKQNSRTTSNPCFGMVGGWVRVWVRDILLPASEDGVISRSGTYPTVAGFDNRVQ